MEESKYEGRRRFCPAWRAKKTRKAKRFFSCSKLTD
jgi:hypothetical protein